MSRFKSLGIRLVLAALLGASLASGFMGCAEQPVNKSDPASLYKDAESDIQSEHYQIAIDKLRVIRNKFPYSKYSVEAQLRIADVYYLQGDYIEAAAAYETFRDLHPKHPKVAYAMFRVGQSYFNDIPGTVARDMTSAQKAVAAFQEFLQEFPDAAEADQARKDLTRARELLAKKELYIGDFYYKRDHYESAKGRYQKILDLYPETPSADQAKKKLEKIAEYEAKHPKKVDEKQTARGSVNNG